MSFLKVYLFNFLPILTPPILKTPPKLVCTNTPTVYPPNEVGITLDEVPIPPLKPKQTVPVPAPIPVPVPRPVPAPVPLLV